MNPDIPSLEFSYTNHRGEEHTYVARPGPLQYRGPNEEDELDSTEPSEAWVIVATVEQRDGEPRPGVRTFRLDGMKDIRQVTSA